MWYNIFVLYEKNFHRRFLIDEQFCLIVYVNLAHKLFSRIILSVLKKR